MERSGGTATDDGAFEQVPHSHRRRKETALLASGLLRASVYNVKEGTRQSMAFAINPEERFAAYNAQMCLALGRQVRDDLHEKLGAANRATEGRDRETTAGLKYRPEPLLACGLVAGIRYCHTADAPDHMGRQLYFSDARSKAMRMVKAWIAAGVRLGVNLGNVVDQRCGIRYIGFHATFTSLDSGYTGEAQGDRVGIKFTFEVVTQAIEQVFQCAGLLTRIDQVGKQLIVMQWVFTKSYSKTGA